VVAREQDGCPVLGEDLPEIGQHESRSVAEQVEHAHQAGAGQAGHPVVGRGLVACQVEQVVALVVGESQRAGQRTEQLGRRLAAAPLLEADDVVDRHAGEHGHLFPPQARGAPAGTVGDADLGRADRLPAAAQEVGELVTLHDLHAPRGR
jgi:hypothetical protein